MEALLRLDQMIKKIGGAGAAPCAGDGLTPQRGPSSDGELAPLQRLPTLPGTEEEGAISPQSRRDLRPISRALPAHSPRSPRALPAICRLRSHSCHIGANQTDSHHAESSLPDGLIAVIVIIINNVVTRLCQPTTTMMRPSMMQITSDMRTASTILEM